MILMTCQNKGFLYSAEQNVWGPERQHLPDKEMTLALPGELILTIPRPTTSVDQGVNDLDARYLQYFHLQFRQPFRDDEKFHI